MISALCLRANSSRRSCRRGSLQTACSTRAQAAGYARATCRARVRCPAARSRAAGAPQQTRALAGDKGLGVAHGRGARGDLEEFALFHHLLPVLHGHPRPDIVCPLLRAHSGVSAGERGRVRLVPAWRKRVRARAAGAAAAAARSGRQRYLGSLPPRQAPLHPHPVSDAADTGASGHGPVFSWPATSTPLVDAGQDATDDRSVRADAVSAAACRGTRRRAAVRDSVRPRASREHARTDRKKPRSAGTADFSGARRQGGKESPK